MPADKTPFAILYVDDEEKARKYFVRIMGDSCPILTAPDVAVARELLARNRTRIGVVVTDQRMPGEQGTELLAELRRTDPAIVRILTTAYADLSSAIAAVNTGAIFHYTTKPWEVDALRALMRTARDHFLLQRERDQLLAEKVETLKRLVVADRVRSYAVLANGLAQRLRHPMEALKAFFQCAPPEALAVDVTGPVQWGDLWDLAGRLSTDLARTVQEVITTTIQEDPRIDAGDIRLAVDEGVSLASADLVDLSVTVEVAPDLPVVHHDRASVARIIRLLCRRLAGHEAERQVTVSIAPHAVYDHPGVRIRLRDTQGGVWDDDRIRACFEVLSDQIHETSRADTDLLAAYFIVYHHAGNLLVNRQEPAGPGFDLLLPVDPRQADLPELDAVWIDRLFTHPGGDAVFGRP